MMVGDGDDGVMMVKCKASGKVLLRVAIYLRIVPRNNLKYRLLIIITIILIIN